VNIIGIGALAWLVLGGKKANRSDGVGLLVLLSPFFGDNFIGLRLGIWPSFGGT